MVREYEFVIIFHPSLHGEALEAEVQTVKKVLESNGATDMKVNDWGRKELPHLAKKQSSGVFYGYNFQSSENDVISKSIVAIRINEKVIKYQAHRIGLPSRKFQGNPKTSTNSNAERSAA